MKRKMLTRIALIIALVMLLVSSVQTTWCFIVTKTDPITGVFVPEQGEANSVTINKTVKHELGKGYSIPIKFGFTVELGAYYANATVTTSGGEVKADASGTIKVSVTPDVPFVISDIKTDTVVKITEDALGAGFSAENGITSKQVTVSQDGAVASFVNIYSPEGVSAQSIGLKGEKQLEGRPWQDGDSFTFVLERLNGADWSTLGTGTVSYSSDADFNKFDMSALLDEVTFNKVGDYIFRVTERQGELENMDYDKTEKSFKVTVTDTDMDGYLEIASVSGTQNASVTKDGEGYLVYTVFNNTFVPLPDPEPITVTVIANKIINNTGELKMGTDGFEMVLENLSTSQKLAFRTEGGKVVFDLIFDKTDIGEHSFLLYETDEGVKGVTYDKARHSITVNVALNEDNELVASINGASSTEFSASFTNIYHLNNDPETPTGDDGAVFWLIMTMVSGGAFIALLIADKRRSEI